MMNLTDTLTPGLFEVPYDSNYGPTASLRVTTAYPSCSLQDRRKVSHRNNLFALSP